MNRPMYSFGSYPMALSSVSLAQRIVPFPSTPCRQTEHLLTKLSQFSKFSETCMLDSSSRETEIEQDTTTILAAQCISVGTDFGQLGSPVHGARRLREA